MATFAYTVLEPNGKKTSGFYDAANIDAARASLTSGGRYLLELSERAARSGYTQNQNEVKKTKGKPGKGDIALFTRRMADLAEAGLPLDRVLQVVAEQSENQQLTDIAEDCLKEVRGGMPVSAALSKYPKFFPTVFTSTLKAGEATGQFGQVAEKLAEFQEKEVARRSQVVSALVYPAILTFAAVGVIVALLTFVIPRLSGVFKELGNDLPASTKLLLGTTDFLTNQWYLVIGGIAGIVVLYRLWVSTESGAEQRDALLMKIPVMGTIVQKSTISRFARVLGTLVYGGVPILDSLELAGLAAGNRVFKRNAIVVQNEVREGKPIAEAMRDTGAFPPVLTHMVAIGEETGDLPKMLGRVCNSLDFEVDNGLRRATSLVEPIIVLTMGGFVGFVVLSVLLPIFQAQNLVK